MNLLMFKLGGNIFRTASIFFTSFSTPFVRIPFKSKEATSISVKSTLIKDFKIRFESFKPIYDLDRMIIHNRVRNACHDFSPCNKYEHRD